ncbi:kinase-like domain-containing protein [Echria macrotheca]|uniref:Kinase-like domain-containing protein n=1 Tax=Echria macrotheca TaxID=438768 RepID=A0AAJ0FG27_9PEZI|nr:kinase-like domain-containing protein [Echria macrotheca]
MLSNALKSFSGTPITTGYQISANPTSTAGPWKIYSAKKKATGKEYSLFVFDKKSLDTHSSGLSRSGAAAFKGVVAEVIERLKKEASSLARLRHPNILELVEPVEETRGGGLQFVTEPVTASLASLLQEKDEQERNGGVGGRSSRYVTEDSEGNRRRRELEIDELEIQKGLLQISKALEFLHENAGLVHANLTPDAVLINAKGDWKISGLAFSSPPQDSDKPVTIALSEALRHDPRLPRTVQLNLDYTSPDFAVDNNLTVAADIFSLGLLCIALYNSPHRSPLECHSNLSTCRKNFSSSGGIPSQTNNFLSSRPIPRDLANYVLPRLITRRPAQRMTAKEFQQSEYFDNILVSTIRFLDSFPAKTPNEKQSFLRGLIKVLPSFPKSVMEKKVLPALLEEMKDKELLSLILHNVFKIIELLPSGRRAFGEKVRPSLKGIFVKPTQEKDVSRDAGLMIILEQLPVIADNCSGAEFKDDVLPIVQIALESATPSLVDAALRSLPTILPVLDFSTIKNELFPVIATIFSKTNSLAIKVRGLQAFVTLCGGSNDPGANDGLDGFGPDKKKTAASVLDKYTMQEKIVPLIKAIKTKEPAVMMAALNALKVIGQAADADFVAMDILPILWSMSLGPLLDLKQFQSFMDLIKSLSSRVEDEQTKKLQELSGGANSVSNNIKDDFMSFGAVAGSALDANGTSETDFEMLVKGKTGGGASNPLESGWDSMTSPVASVTSPGLTSGGKTTPTPAFSWSTPSPVSTTNNQFGAVKAQQPSFRTVTPDLNRFESLTPTSTQFSQPLQPSNTQPNTVSPLQQSTTSTAVNWGATPAAASNPWSTPSQSMASQPNAPTSAFGSMSLGQMQSTVSSQASRVSSFSLPPPPGGSSGGGTSTVSGFSLAPPPGGPQRQTSFGGMGSMGSSVSSMASLSTGGSGMMGGMNSMNNGVNSMNSMMNKAGGMGTSMNMGMGMGMGMGMAQQQKQQQPQSQQPQGQKSGLDKYASLL